MSSDYSKHVDYDLADPVKITAQKAALSTNSLLSSHGVSEVGDSRGESAYVVDLGDHYIALTQEGLGTKSLITQAVYEATGQSFFKEIAIDTVGTIVNDLVTVGALPLAVNAYWSASSYSWMEDKKVATDLIEGWRQATVDSGATWGGGETQSLSGVINPGVLELAGSGIGLIKPKSQLTLGQKLTPGDQIILLASSGIHANGVSLARSLADDLADGYQTKLDSGQTYGEALLAPSILYPGLIASLFEQGVDIHYLTHITGHGWRKIMRNNKQLTYRIEKIMPVPEVLSFIQKKQKMSDQESYATFNMGAGFAVFVDPTNAEKVLQTAKRFKIDAIVAGEVQEGPRRVIIEPLQIEYSGESLSLRA